MLPPPRLPSDFELTYEWHAGSIPPPYHYEYLIHVNADGRGEIEYRLGYGREEVWKEPLNVPMSALEGGYGMMVRVGVMSRQWSQKHSPAVGGSREAYIKQR